MTKERSQLPSGFQLGQIVSVVFPGNNAPDPAILHNCRITKIAFTDHNDPLYDVDVPFTHYNYDEEDYDYGKPFERAKTGFVRLHALRQWFLSYTQEDWDKMQVEEKASPSMLDDFGKAIGMIPEKSKD